MMRFDMLRRTAVIACAVLALSGCETVNDTYSNVRGGLSDFFSSSSSAPAVASSDDDRTQSLRQSPVESAALVSARGEDITAQELPPQQLSAAAINGVECPPVTVIEELRTLHQFTEGTTARAENNISTVSIASVKTSCTANDNNLAVDLTVTFEGELGARAKEWNMDTPSFAYPYFIATTTPGGTIAAKEVFTATISYERGIGHVVREEKIRQIIPTGGAVYGHDHEILIGFQLTEAELAYNRSLMGLKYEPVATQAPAPAPVAEKKKVVAKPPKPRKAPQRPQAVEAEAAQTTETPVAAEPVVSEAPVEPSSATETAPVEATIAPTEPAPAKTDEAVETITAPVEVQMETPPQDGLAAPPSGEEAEDVQDITAPGAPTGKKPPL